MKTIKLVGICMILASSIMAGCTEKVDESIILTGKQVSGIDSSKITKSSHHVSYIPLNLSGYPHKNRELIIEVIEEFRKKYPSLDIKSEQIEFQSGDHSSNACTYGIWIFHEPRKE